VSSSECFPTFRRIMVPSYARVTQSVATHPLIRLHIPHHLHIQQKRCEKLRSVLPDRYFHFSFLLSVFHKKKIVLGIQLSAYDILICYRWRAEMFKTHRARRNKKSDKPVVSWNTLNKCRHPSVSSAFSWRHSVD